mmetsp:Transcript_41443/g.39882  ORF Transcript_41443/g.39882 Transcript_41443/m.39882 type:complete len:181 (+) Transcript_41443:366-908(+)
MALSSCFLLPPLHPVVLILRALLPPHILREPVPGPVPHVGRVHKGHPPRPPHYPLVTSSTHVSKEPSSNVSMLLLPPSSHVVHCEATSSKQPSQQVVEVSPTSTHPWLLEEHPEDILWVEVVTEKRRLRRVPISEFFFRPELIIVFPFLRITKACKGLVEFLEGISSLRVSVLIGVQFQG